MNMSYYLLLCYREDEFSKKLWDKTSTHVFEAIYLPASSSTSLGYVPGLQSNDINKDSPFKF